MEQAARVGGDLARIRALFVAPHLDDVALSCGGIVARHVAMGEPALIVTVFAGQPRAQAQLSEFARFQHNRWGTGDQTARVRQQEDDAAATALGASSLRLAYLDAIYRGDQYLSDEDLFGAIKPGDVAIVAQIADDLIALWKQTSRATVYLPLGVGNHVDHQIGFAAGEPLHNAGATVWYYEEFPYGAAPGALEARLAALPVSLAPRVVDVTDYFDQRLKAIAAYASQIPTIFRHYGPFEEVTRRYAAGLATRSGGYGERVWSLRTRVDPESNPGNET